jgi:hypothetical protein
MSNENDKNTLESDDNLGKVNPQLPEVDAGIAEQETKITEITPEQRAQMSVYVDKWIKIGTNTDRLDSEKTAKIIKNYRNLIDKPVDVPLHIVENPIEAWAACQLLTNFGVSHENLREELEAVFNGNPKKYDIPSPRLPWQCGSFFVSTFAFYDYVFECLGVEIASDLWAKYKVWESTSELGCIYPLDEYTVVCQKPTECHLNERRVLHRDGAPALAYAGYGDIKIYMLNGVNMPEHVVMTPEEKLDLEYYNQITNADVKAEFVRKVGIERFKTRGKLLDSWKTYTGDEYALWHASEYELWDMEAIFNSLDTAPYLSMVNQTTGIFHFEGVSPKCQTLKDAIMERLGGRDLLLIAIK